MINLGLAVNITVHETELVELDLESSDPDSDNLSYNFSLPLNSEGEWQTTYGDAGEYSVEVTVSDGDLSSTEILDLVVLRKEEEPVIDLYAPQGEIELDEGGIVEFIVSASDLNNDGLSYLWIFDESEISGNTSYTYQPNFFEQGEHVLKIEVSDGTTIVYQEWLINVNDVNRNKLLDLFEDVAINETEKLVLNLPDFSKYNLDFEISEPIGEDGVWQTGYDDAGEYTVTIDINDGDFSADKEILVIVDNVDRPPVISSISNVKLDENQVVTITLEAQDPDGDEIQFSGYNLPDGINIQDNVFVWETNYDTVKRDNLLNQILHKFHLLSKNHKVTFVAESNGLRSEEEVSIRVNDVNRVPVLDDLENITVKEGEWLELSPSAIDPDGDKISFSYSGWVKKIPYYIDYDEAGEHKILVTVSDGFLKETKELFVNVEDVNRNPWLINNNLSVIEGENISIILDVIDPDGDLVDITAGVLPNGASLVDNEFKWEVPFDITKKGEITAVLVTFVLSDGKSNVTVEFNIYVKNVNKAPEIVEFSPIESFGVNAGSTVTFEVKTQDFDGDDLTYIWDFGLFDKHESGSAHRRGFTVPGTKKIKVIVSDGETEVEHEWEVNVITKKIEKKVVKKVEQPVEPVEKPIEKLVEPKKPEPKPVEPVQQKEPNILTFVIEG